MQIERTFTLQAPADAVWIFFNDPQAVGKCLPGCQSVEDVGDGSYKAFVGLKVGPVKAGFNLLVETLEKRPPDFASYRMKGSDKEGASKVSADCELRLAAISDGQTEVHYIATSSIVGRLAKFGSGMISKFSETINDQFVKALTKSVEEASGRSGGGADLLSEQEAK